MKLQRRETGTQYKIMQSGNITLHYSLLCQRAVDLTFMAVIIWHYIAMSFCHCVHLQRLENNLLLNFCLRTMKYQKPHKGGV